MKKCMKLFFPVEKNSSTFCIHRFAFIVPAFICGVSETEARMDDPGTNFNFFHESASPVT